jgi:hypothetical protein
MAEAKQHLYADCPELCKPVFAILLIVLGVRILSRVLSGSKNQ